MTILTLLRQWAGPFVGFAVIAGLIWQLGPLLPILQSQWNRIYVILGLFAICGGITEMRKIAAIASIFDISIASHNTVNGIPTTAALHFWVATQNARYPQEYDFHAVRPDYGLRLVKDPVVAKDGYLTPPDKPGLGVELNTDEIAKLSA